MIFFFSVLDDWQNVLQLSHLATAVLANDFGPFFWLRSGCLAGRISLATSRCCWRCSWVHWVDFGRNAGPKEWHDMSYGQYSWLISIKNGASHPMGPIGIYNNHYFRILIMDGMTINHIVSIDRGSNGDFQKWGYPNSWMIWGYPHFRKPPNGPGEFWWLDIKICQDDGWW